MGAVGLADGAVLTAVVAECQATGGEPKGLGFVGFRV